MLSFPPKIVSQSGRRYLSDGMSAHPVVLKILTIHAVILASVFGGAIAARAENPDHVRQLLETNECEECDLSGSRLEGLDLTGANLQGSQLNGANLTNTTLTRANLQDVNLSQTTLTGTTLQGANLTNASLQDATIGDSCIDFFGTMMFGASSEQSTCVAIKLLNILGADQFCEADQWVDEEVLQLSGLCNPDDLVSMTSPFFSQLFVTPNFQGANFSDADLTGVNLRTADLRYATLSGANLTNTTLDLAIVMDAVLENTQGGDFSQAIFSSQDMVEAIVPMVMQQAIASYESEAKSALGSMNRAQQSYYFEQGEFSATVADLKTGISEETDHYHYSIAQTSADLAIQAAVPKRDDLSSYLGMVYLQPDEEVGDIVFLTALCVSNLPATPIPTIPGVSLNSDSSTSDRLACPEGFWDYLTGTASGGW